jgi:lysozyme family protein
VSFLVVQDIEHFALSCISAQSKLLSKFMAASERLNLSANALRTAYNEQKADLEDVAASEKLVDDLILRVIFAAAGGGAGGAVGGWLKTVRRGSSPRPTTSSTPRRTR